MRLRPLLAATGLALSAAGAMAEAQHPIRIAIAAGKIGEACMPLAAGDTLIWQFSATAAGDFNLHQHIGKDVLMPVERKAVREDRGEYRVEQANEWCLMWTAPKGSTMNVAGAWSVRKAAAAR